VSAPDTILLPLFLTITIESLILLALTSRPWTEVLLYSVLINAVTLPPATFLYHEVLPDLFLVEVLVTGAETVLIALLFRLPAQRSLILSIAANGTTALAGVLLAGII
jgi:hypothetical protein